MLLSKGSKDIHYIHINSTTTAASTHRIMYDTYQNSINKNFSKEPNQSFILGFTGSKGFSGFMLSTNWSETVGLILASSWPSVEVTPAHRDLGEKKPLTNPTLLWSPSHLHGQCHRQSQGTTLAQAKCRPSQILTISSSSTQAPLQIIAPFEAKDPLTTWD